MSKQRTLGAGAWTVLALMACGPGRDAKFPDHAKVVSAEEAWCAMLAKLDDSTAEKWAYRKACTDAVPTASAAFLRRLTKCYPATIAEYGSNSPDSGAIIDSCTHKILGGVQTSDVSTTPLFKARCARQQKCQQVTPEICAGAWTRLDGKTQALLTSQYNLAAQMNIANCLEDKDCGDDDAANESACYDAVRADLVWFPLSIARDPSIGPS